MSQQGCSQPGDDGLYQSWWWREGGGPGLAWAWGKKAPWRGEAVTLLSQSHGTHLLKWAASWSCKN